MAQSISISSILKNAAASSTKKIVLAQGDLKLEAHKFVNAKTNEVKVVFTLTFPEGLSVQFGSNPKKWEEANGYENSDFVKQVIESKSWADAFGAHKPTTNGL